MTNRCDDLAQEGITADRNPFAQIERIIAADPGKRGIASLVVPGDLEHAARRLLRATRVALVTGFFIPSAGTCETDGPPGVCALGAALGRLGIEGFYVTDGRCQEVLRAAGLTPLFDVTQARSMNPPPDCLVAVERPGSASDGRYYNMRGSDITDWTAPLDAWFLERPPSPTVTIGVGDGGNEIGMGKVRAQVARYVPRGDAIASVVGTHHLIVAGVSNWGAWGLVAAMALLARQPLLPTVFEAQEALTRLVAAGAVDGVSGRQKCTVDGLAWDVHAGILQALHDVLAEPGME